MKKGKWSMEEDNLIKNHIEKYGIGRSWQALSNTLGLQRCGRSCRSRWLNYLRPGLKHGNFTPAEERIICEMYSKRGSCWSVIATQLPGRTDLAIKNYWHSTLERRFPAERSATARRRHRPTGSTSSDATSPDLALVVYNEGTTTGSSGHASVHIPLLADSPPVQTQVQSPLAAACILGKEEPAEQGAVMRCVPLEKVPPPLPPPGDQTGEMDIICAPMSPIPLAFLEPDVPWITGFDEIGSYLWWFDN